VRPCSHTCSSVATLAASQPEALRAAVDGRRGVQNVLVAGSRDALLSVWPLAAQGKGRGALPLDAGPSHYLYGHDSPINALAVSSALRVVASGALNGSLLLHHIPTGRLLRTFARLPTPACHMVICDMQPAVVVHSAGDRRLRTLHVLVRRIFWGCFLCFVRSLIRFWVSLIRFWVALNAAAREAGNVTRRTRALGAVPPAARACRATRWQRRRCLRQSTHSVCPHVVGRCWWLASDAKAGGALRRACARPLPLSCSGPTASRCACARPPA
jgi:hypothetical protein